MPDADPIDLAELAEHLRADQQHCWQRGERVWLETYLKRHPELLDAEEQLLDLLYNEVLLREQLGECPSLDEYLRRFPQHARQLRRQFLVHQFLKPTAVEAADSTTASASAPSGDIHVDGYEILGELGRGGMGVVYKARQLSLNRTVALKMILSGAQASPRYADRLRAEAQAVAMLQHPNIVQIFEVGECAGRPYLALELVDGVSLAQHASGVPQPPRQAAHLVAILARAVEAAHQVGIVHRDLKPANVLLSRQIRQTARSDHLQSLPHAPGSTGFLSGEPKITDFGLAKRLETDNGMTQSGEIMGTPSYMAPEQAIGATKDVGPLADVYALGAIFYELLTGRPPFRAATVLDTLDQVRNAEPVAPTNLQPAVPRDLETICLKCLQKAPNRRYLSAAALAEDLERFLDGKPILARRVSVWERSWKWAKRRPATAGLIVISTLAALSLLGLWARLTSQLQAERNYARQEQTKAVQQKSIADTERDRAEQYLYNARINLAQQAWHESNIHRMITLLEAQLPQGSSSDWRGPEWHYLWRLCHCDQRTLAGHTRFTRHIAFSPDGRLLASAGDDETVALWDTMTGEKLDALRQHLSYVSDIAFSPDGSQLVSGSGDHSASTWDTATGRKLLTLRGHTAPVYGVTFSPRGGQIATAGRDGTVRVWDATRGDELFTLAGHSGPVVSVAYDAAGRRLVSGSDDQTIRIWDVETRQTVVTRQMDARVLCVAFGPNSSGIAVGGSDGKIRICSGASCEEVQLLQGHEGAVSGVAFDASGLYLASSSWDRTVRLWDMATGRLQRIFRGHLGLVLTVAFHPDGKRLASASQEIKVWDATLDQESWPLSGHDGEVRSVAFSPIRAILASAGSDGTVRLWETAKGAEQSVFRDHDDSVLAVAFSSDGQRIASGSRDRTIRIRRLGPGGDVATLTGHTDAVNGVAFSPDGSRLASASRDQTVKVWDLASGEPPITFRGHASFVHCVAFSPSGQHIASGGWNGSIKLWDVGANTLSLTLAGHGAAVPCVAFSRDGQLLASGGEDNLVKLWSIPSGRLVRVFQGHTCAVAGVAFNSDGRRLVSCGGNLDQPGELKMWDVGSGQELLTLRSHTAEVTSVAFNSDGQSWASASRDGTIRIWNAPLSAEP